MGHKKRGASPAGYTISLPIGTVHGNIPFLEDKPHMLRIVLFMSEALPRVKTEINYIKISKDRNRSRYTQDLIRVVAAHLPEALKELQTASVNRQDSMYEHEKIKQYMEKIEADISYYKQKTKENEENLTDELRQAQENEEQYKHLLLQMKTSIENNEQKITKLKMSRTLQEKATEYQRLKTEYSDLHQENQTLKEQLELEKNRAKEQEENLNLTMQKLSHEQIEKIKAFQRFCEIQSNKHNEELEIEKHNAVLLKSAVEKDRIFNVSQEKEKMKILKERNNLFDELKESKEHILRYESKIKNLKSEISNLKVAHEMQQEVNEKELGKFQKQNQHLLLDNIKLSKTFQQENDNAKTHQREYDAIREEMLELREKLGKAVQRLKAAEDIQRKLNVENYDLKNEMIVLREEKIKFEAHYTHQKENERGQNAHETELNRIKLASEMKQEELGKEIHKAQQQNQQLLQDIEKLYNDLHHERENSKKLQTECDIVTKELQMLKETQEEKKFRLDKSNDIQQKLATAKVVKHTCRGKRLSRTMLDTSTDTDIADLSDRNRPIKISERYQELYDNQWIDAFEVVDGTKRNEEKTIETLMDILLETMDFCKAESANQMKTITETLSKEKDISANTMKQIKDLRKSSAENYGKGLYTEYLSRLNQSKSVATKIPSFVKECFEICWLMAVQDPPVVLGPEIRRDTPFNKDHYKAFTKGGKRLDYVVWPVLLLHQDGPVLCKGVAQGY